MVSLKIANDEHIKEEEESIRENDALKREIMEINLRHIEEINNIRLVVFATNRWDVVRRGIDVVFVRTMPE